MSSANRRRTSVIGALPGRKPGMRAMRAISRATFSATLVTLSAGISSSISRLQVVSLVIRKSLSRANVPQAPDFYPPFNDSESGKEDCRNERQRPPQQKFEYREYVCARQPRSAGDRNTQLLGTTAAKFRSRASVLRTSGDEVSAGNCK